MTESSQWTLEISCRTEEQFIGVLVNTLINQTNKSYLLFISILIGYRFWLSPQNMFTFAIFGAAKINSTVSVLLLRFTGISVNATISSIKRWLSVGF